MKFELLKKLGSLLPRTEITIPVEHQERIRLGVVLSRLYTDPSIQTQLLDTEEEFTPADVITMLGAENPTENLERAVGFLLETREYSIEKLEDDESLDFNGFCLTKIITPEEIRKINPRARALYIPSEYTVYLPTDADSEEKAELERHELWHHLTNIIQPAAYPELYNDAYNIAKIHEAQKIIGNESSSREDQARALNLLLFPSYLSSKSEVISHLSSSEELEFAVLLQLISISGR